MVMMPQEDGAHLDVVDLKYFLLQVNHVQVSIVRNLIYRTSQPKRSSHEQFAHS